MNKYIRSLRDWLRTWRVVWRTDYDREVASLRGLLQRANVAHAERLKEEREIIRRMAERGSALDWSRERGDEYRLALSFSPKMIGSHAGYGDKRELEILADVFADRVRAEVLTCRFVRAANEHEYKRAAPRWP